MSKRRYCLVLSLVPTFNEPLFRRHSLRQDITIIPCQAYSCEHCLVLDECHWQEWLLNNGVHVGNSLLKLWPKCSHQFSAGLLQRACTRPLCYHPWSAYSWRRKLLENAIISFCVGIDRNCNKSTAVFRVINFKFLSGQAFDIWLNSMSVECQSAFNSTTICVQNKNTIRVEYRKTFVWSVRRRSSYL